MSVCQRRPNLDPLATAGFQRPSIGGEFQPSLTSRSCSPTMPSPATAAACVTVLSTRSESYLSGEANLAR
jgi:hypothetical protein